MIKVYYIYLNLWKNKEIKNYNTLLLLLLLLLSLPLLLLLLLGFWDM